MAPPVGQQKHDTHDSKQKELIGIGFVFYKEEDAVKWLYWGSRCPKCKALGCFGDWLVGYGPSKDIKEKA